MTGHPKPRALKAASVKPATLRDLRELIADADRAFHPLHDRAVDLDCLVLGERRRLFREDPNPDFVQWEDKDVRELRRAARRFSGLGQIMQRVADQLEAVQVDRAE